MSDNSEILILQLFQWVVGMLEVVHFTRRNLRHWNGHRRDVLKDFLRVSVHQLLLSPVTLSPTPSTSSAVKTLQETEEDPIDPEPAYEGGVKVEYFPDQLYRPRIGAVTRNYL